MGAIVDDFRGIRLERLGNRITELIGRCGDLVPEPGEISALDQCLIDEGYGFDELAEAYCRRGFEHRLKSEAFAAIGQEELAAEYRERADACVYIADAHAERACLAAERGSSSTARPIRRCTTAGPRQGPLGG